MGKNLSLFLLRMNVFDIGLLQYKSVCSGHWFLSSVFFSNIHFSETGLISVIRCEDSYLVEPEVETSPFGGAHPSRNFVPDNISRSSFQDVVSEKPYDVDSVQNNADCKFISSGVGGVKKGRRVCLVGLLVNLFKRFKLLGIRANSESRNVLCVYSRSSSQGM